MNSNFNGWLIGTFSAWCTLFVLCFGLLWTPIMGPWIQERQGAANLAQAEQERKILIEQAQAEEAAAKHRKKAIEVVGQAARDFPEYRYQEYLANLGEAMMKCNINTIYVPTEGNVPLVKELK